MGKVGVWGNRTELLVRVGDFAVVVFGALDGGVILQDAD